MAGAVIAAGLAGLADGIELPDPVQIEPSRVADELGLELLPENCRRRRTRWSGSQLRAVALGEPPARRDRGPAAAGEACVRPRS